MRVLWKSQTYHCKLSKDLGGGSVRRAHMHCTYCGSKEHNVNACPKTWSGNAARAWNPESVADDFVEDKKPNE